MARKRYGDENVEDCKLLLRKYFDTIPASVTEFINFNEQKRMAAG